MSPTSDPRVRRAGAGQRRGRRRHQPRLRALRHGAGAGRRAVGQPHRHESVDYLVAVVTTTARRSAPSPASTTNGCSPTPRTARACGRWRSTRRPAPRRRRGADPCAGRAVPRRGRAYMDLSVMHDNAAAIALYEKLGFERVPVFAVKRKNAINEPLFTGDARDHRRPQPVRPDHRRRGAAPRHQGRGARRRGGRAAPVARRAQHRDPRVAVRAHHRGGDEPLRRQAPHPAHRRRGRPGGAKAGWPPSTTTTTPSSTRSATWWSSRPGASRARASPSA